MVACFNPRFLMFHRIVMWHHAFIPGVSCFMFQRIALARNHIVTVTCGVAPCFNSRCIMFQRIALARNHIVTVTCGVVLCFNSRCIMFHVSAHCSCTEPHCDGDVWCGIMLLFQMYHLSCFSALLLHGTTL